MAYTDIIRQNFAGGELTKKLRGRSDLQLYANATERMQNYIAETQGPARFRTGSFYVHHTRLNQFAILIPFQFNDAQAYELEFTDGFMRVYKDEAIVLEDDSKSITGITQANPGVITSTAHGFANGDEIFITDVVGMTELNGSFFLVANVTANTFTLTDIDGAAIDTSGFTAYSSGGTLEKVFEIVSPYAEADLLQLKYAQNADTMYIVHPSYEPYKLTRADHDDWTLTTFTRINDPFSFIISAITQANPGVVTATGHNFLDGDIIVIRDVVGMTEVNDNRYKVANKTANTFELTDPDTSADINTTGFTAYASGGYVYNELDMPGSCAFYEGRFDYGGTPTRPESIFLSRGPEDDGTPRYDDFTAGTDADHAMVITLAPVHGRVDNIEWLAGNNKYLLAGTFGGVTKATGGRDDEPITPTGISVKPVEPYGCADINPIANGNVLLYVQRGSLIVRSFEFDNLADSFIAVDRNLASDDIMGPGVSQLAFQTGRPDILWAARKDGVLIGLTFKSREDVSGWHRHFLGGTSDAGTYGKVLSVGVMTRTSNEDQVWVVVERIINGVTRRYVEFLKDPIKFPDPEDFYTGEDNEEEDKQFYLDTVFELQKEYVHLDSAISFNGADRGVAAGATITPAATTGVDIVFTASAPVFTANDVGNEIWKKLGLERGDQGRAKITEFTSTTSVKCQILKNYDSTDVIAAGNWYLTAASVSGLGHLEGETITVCVDGGLAPSQVVTDGVITVPYQFSMIHVGIFSRGIIKLLNAEIGGFNGPGQTKMKNIKELVFRFLNTLGGKFGTSLYSLQTIINWNNKNITGRPSPVSSDLKRVKYSDVWRRAKHVYFVQDVPLPCSIQFIDIYAEVTNE